MGGGRKREGEGVGEGEGGGEIAPPFLCLGGLRLCRPLGSGRVSHSLRKGVGFRRDGEGGRVGERLGGAGVGVGESWGGLPHEHR